MLPQAKNKKRKEKKKNKSLCIAYIFKITEYIRLQYRYNERTIS